MNILISNDDGVLAPGIQAIAKALKVLGRVVVVAPESERSGFSSALTIDRPLRPIEISPDVWAVNGTPADCVYLALNGLFDFKFDLVVSGINNGPNLADHILYSGTVGAAMGGRLNHLPSLAISLCGAQVRAYQSVENFKRAAEWVRDFIQDGLPVLPSRHILNINIPDVNEILGSKVTYQSQCTDLKPIIPQVDPRGRQVYWIGLSSSSVAVQKSGFEQFISDADAVAEGYVSITPIQIDSTNYDVLHDLHLHVSQKPKVVL